MYESGMQCGRVVGLVVGRNGDRSSDVKVLARYARLVYYFVSVILS